MSLQRKFLVSRLGSVMLNTNRPRQCGTHRTKRKTAEMRGCHREEGDVKKFQAGLPAQVPTSSVAEISRWHRKAEA